MNRMGLSGWPGCLLLGTLLTACGSGGDEQEQIDKSELLGMKADAVDVCAKFGQPPPPDCDLCAVQGWYGDGTCDAALIADGLCIGPDPDCQGACTEDADCPMGQQWCEEGECVPCDNSGMWCEIYCAYGFVTRNGCTPCECAEPPACGDGVCDQTEDCTSCEADCGPCEPSCTDDSDCAYGEQWCEEGECVPCDNSGMWCELYCEDGFVIRNGCTPCECA